MGAVFFRVEGDGDAAEGAVVHVEGARPRYLGWIEIERIAVEEVRIDHGGQQVVRGGDGMEVAVKVEIDFLAGLNLREAAAGRAALEAEDGAERGLARGDDCRAANAFKTLRQADGGNGLAFTGDGGGGGCDQYELATNREGRIGEQIERELGAVRADGFIMYRRERQLACDFLNGQHERLR